MTSDYSLSETVPINSLVVISLPFSVLVISGLYSTFSLYTYSEGVSVVDGVKTLKFVLGSSSDDGSIMIAGGSSKRIAITVTNSDNIPLKALYIIQLVFSCFPCLVITVIILFILYIIIDCRGKCSDRIIASFCLSSFICCFGGFWISGDFIDRFAESVAEENIDCSYDTFRNCCCYCCSDCFSFCLDSVFCRTMLSQTYCICCDCCICYDYCDCCQCFYCCGEECSCKLFKQK